MGRFTVIVPVQFDCIRYPYNLNEDGTRKIYKELAKPEKLEFKFSTKELELIIYRGQPDKLTVDDKEMYFDVSNGKLIGIHFENNDFIWVVVKADEVLSECVRLYISIKTTDFLTEAIYNSSASNVDIYDPDNLADEFEV